MPKRFVLVFGHGLMLTVVCAIAAFWGMRILAPQPSAAQQTMAPVVPREPDPVLAARMFGLVERHAVRTAMNIQVTGIFAAGADSSAILMVDDKPARVFLLGQNVAAGVRLVEVQANSVVIESEGGRRELRLQPRSAAITASKSPVGAQVSGVAPRTQDAAASTASPLSPVSTDPPPPPTAVARSATESPGPAEQPQLGASAQPATSGDPPGSIAPSALPRPPRPPAASREARRPGMGQPAPQ